MTRVILSLQATHTALAALAALQRDGLSCAVAAQVTESRRAGAEPEGLSFLAYRTSAVVGSWLPTGGIPLVAGIFGGNPGKDLCSHPSLTLDPSSMQEGGP